MTTAYMNQGRRGPGKSATSCVHGRWGWSGSWMGAKLCALDQGGSLDRLCTMIEEREDQSVDAEGGGGRGMALG